MEAIEQTGPIDALTAGNSETRAHSTLVYGTHPSAGGMSWKADLELGAKAQDLLGHYAPLLTSPEKPTLLAELVGKLYDNHALKLIECVRPGHIEDVLTLERDHPIIADLAVWQALKGLPLDDADRRVIDLALIGSCSRLQAKALRKVNQGEGEIADVETATATPSAINFVSQEKVDPEASELTADPSNPFGQAGKSAQAPEQADPELQRRSERKNRDFFKRIRRSLGKNWHEAEKEEELLREARYYAAKLLQGAVSDLHLSPDPSKADIEAARDRVRDRLLLKALKKFFRKRTEIKELEAAIWTEEFPSLEERANEAIQAAIRHRGVNETPPTETRGRANEQVKASYADPLIQNYKFVKAMKEAHENREVIPEVSFRRLVVETLGLPENEITAAQLLDARLKLMKEYGVVEFELGDGGGNDAAPMQPLRRTMPLAEMLSAGQVIEADADQAKRSGRIVPPVEESHSAADLFAELAERVQEAVRQATDRASGSDATGATLAHPATVANDGNGASGGAAIWDVVEICFLDADNAQVTVAGAVRRLSYAEMGFGDRRGVKVGDRGPNKAWGWLRRLAEQRGVIDLPERRRIPVPKGPRDAERQPASFHEVLVTERAGAVKARTQLHTCMKDLRRCLQSHFGTNDNPILFEQTRYRAQFKIGYCSSYHQ